MLCFAQRKYRSRIFFQQYFYYPYATRSPIHKKGEKMKLIKRFMECVSLGYHFFWVFVHLIYGVWRVSKLSQPIVSIFGSALITQTDKYSKEANQIAAWLVESGISVLTGG